MMDSSESSGTAENDMQRIRKDNAMEFLHLIGERKPKEGLHVFASDCKTHNPCVSGDINALIDAMIAVQKQGPEGIVKGSTADFKLKIKNVGLTATSLRCTPIARALIQAMRGCGRFIFSVSA